MFTFPYHGVYTSKKSGYEWHYWVDEDGFISCVERHYYDHYNGKDHLKYKKGAITKELLKDIEKKFGKKTDGWRWMTADDIQYAKDMEKMLNGD